MVATQATPQRRGSSAVGYVLAGAVAWVALSGPLAFVPQQLGSFLAGGRSATAIQGAQVRSAICVAEDGREVSAVVMRAAKKAAAGGAPICDGDTVYIKVSTGKYIGELDGTSRKEWVKARGTKKDADHALTIEKAGGGEISSGDIVKIVMPLSVTNGTKLHMDVVGSAVRARYYDQRGEWQKMTIIKQEGGAVCDGDTIFLRSVFMNGRDYLDANPLEKAPDGELKCRWPDEGEWQVMTIEK